MTSIDRLSSVAPLGQIDAGRTGGARAAAEAAVGEIGHRALAWTAEVGGESAGSALWGTRAGEGSGFAPDMGALARRGDVHGLSGMARDIAGKFGATPTQEGGLRRALEDFTRQAMVQVVGLSGANGGRQVAGLGRALDAAGASGGGEGIDGVVARLESATATLARENGA